MSLLLFSFLHGGPQKRKENPVFVSLGRVNGWEY
jgi:hypothetical protein